MTEADNTEERVLRVERMVEQLTHQAALNALSRSQKVHLRSTAIVIFTAPTAPPVKTSD